MYEASFVFLVSKKMVGQELESYYALEFGVLGFVDDTHAAFAEFFENTIMRYSLPNHGPHLRNRVFSRRDHFVARI